MHVLVAAVFANLLCLLQSWKMVAKLWVEECDPNAKIDEDADLSVATLHVIPVDKDTRKKMYHYYYSKSCDEIIFAVSSRWKNPNIAEIYWNQTVDQDDLSKVPKYDSVFGMLVVRKDKTCENDNPVTFFHKRYKECGCKKEPGSGSDFSSMYDKSPFRPGRIEIILYKDNAEKQYHSTLLNYTPPADCYATDTWIANQGLYLLDLENKVWYPVYYDLWSDEDFFIM
ncbi:unnamed protein product [Cylicocyclus nassatus]|uniref:Uncharacterized protein n=1 Tax=Cylicocyclus nassatus TaxID=53992 RepID=A0AA36DRW6_CYLNA|nr:unnamed protein product [Cylicocyclus nassatus]